MDRESGWTYLFENVPHLVLIVHPGLKTAAKDTYKSLIFSLLNLGGKCSYSRHVTVQRIQINFKCLIPSVKATGTV